MSSATAGSRPAGQRNNVRDGKKLGKPRGDATAATANAADRTSDKRGTSGHSKPPSNHPKYNQERAQYASLLNDKIDSDDIEAKVNEVFELTKASKDTIIVALHDSDGDLNRAVSKILEGDYDDNWTEVQMRKRKEKQEKPTTQQGTVSKANEKGNTNGTTRPHQANRGRNPRQAKASGEPRPPRQHKKDADSAVANSEEKQPPNDSDRPPKKGPREIKERKGQSHPVRGRGTRTFSNQQRESNAPKSDEFPNSIDTWSNTAVDQNSRPPATIASMPVGNWSDVVAGGNEDWASEEDYDLMGTKVFEPSNKPLSEKEEEQPSLDRLVSKQCDPKQSELSDQNRRETVGAQILQSLKHPSHSGFTDQQFNNRQAAESIKSLVGIPTASYTGSNTSELPSAKPQRMNTARRATKIPEKAVEMPTSDSVASLGVQFGALEVNFGSADQNAGYSEIKPSQNSNANTAQVIPNKVVSSNSVLVSSTYDQNKPTLGTGELRDDMLKGSGFGAKVSDDSRSPMNKQVKSVMMDTVKGGDLYSSSMSNQASNDSGFSKTASPYASYGGTQNFSAGATSASYQGPSSYSGQNAAVFSGSNSNYSSAYPSANAASNAAQKNLTGLKELDPSAVSVGGQIKHNTSYDLHGGASAPGLVNSTTQTTNVLKNSLPATGNGSKNMAQQSVPPRMLTQMLHHPPPYIMGGPGMPFYSVYDPNQIQMTPGQDAQTFAAAYNPNAGTEHKFSRTEGADANVTTPSATSQAPVVSQHQQQFIAGTFPPGYGYYFTIPPQAGIHPFTPQGAPFVPVPAANNAPHSSATAPGFAKNSSYPSHSYPSSYDASMTGVPTNDYAKQQYGQPSNQHQSKTISGNADLMASQSYGKSHGQVSKVTFSLSIVTGIVTLFFFLFVSATVRKTESQLSSFQFFQSQCWFTGRIGSLRNWFIYGSTNASRIF